MATRYRLNPETREKLKKPIGTLVQGSFNETMEKLKNIINKDMPPLLISVGDLVSQNLAEINMFSRLAIIDNRIMRRQIQPISLTADRTIYIKNPPGTITDEAIISIQEAIASNCRVKIVVDGEEDLLTLVAALHAPENAIIIYGQPFEGVVIVKATKQKKKEIIDILKGMELSSKT